MTKSDKLLAKLVLEVDMVLHPNDFTRNLRKYVLDAEQYLVEKYDVDSIYEIKKLTEDE